MDADGGDGQAGGSGSGEQGEEGGEDGGLALDSELTPEEIMMMQQMGIPFVSGLCMRFSVRCTYWESRLFGAVSTAGAVLPLLPWMLLSLLLAGQWGSCCAGFLALLELPSSLHASPSTAAPPSSTLPPQGFDTTQGKKHEDAGAVKIKSTRGARQYMNRRVRACSAAGWTSWRATCDGCCRAQSVNNDWCMAGAALWSPAGLVEYSSGS